MYNNGLFNPDMYAPPKDFNKASEDGDEILSKLPIYGPAPKGFPQGSLYAASAKNAMLPDSNGIPR